MLQIRDFKSDDYATYIPEALNKRWCEKEDIMIGRYGPPIFQILRGKSGSYNVALIKAEPKEGIHRDYLYYILKQENLYQLIDRLSSRTSGQTGIDMAALESFPVNLPPLREQRKITDILGTWDEALQKLDALIAAKDRRKEALMQQLLTGQHRLQGFSKRWKRVKLSEVAEECSIRNGQKLDRTRLYAVTKAEGMVPMRETVQGATINRCQIVERGWFAYNPMRINIGSIARWESETQ